MRSPWIACTTDCSSVGLVSCTWVPWVPVFPTNSVGVAWMGARVLDGLWLDPRGGILDSYVQRNAMVVGSPLSFVTFRGRGILTNGR